MVKSTTILLLNSFFRMLYKVAILILFDWELRDVKVHRKKINYNNDRKLGNRIIIFWYSLNLPYFAQVQCFSQHHNVEEAFFILETILITSELHPEQIQIKLHGSVLNIIARRLVKPRSRLWLMLLFTFKGNIHIWNESSYSENCRLQWGRLQHQNCKPSLTYHWRMPITLSMCILIK